VKTVKRIASISALAAGGMAMFPTVVLAHHPTASDSCEGLSVDMTSYPGPGTPNTLTVTIDQKVVLQTSFGETFSQWFPWSPTDDHHWVVVVDGATPDGDETLTGMEYACPVPDTHSASDVPTTTEAPTTTAAASTTTEAPIALVSPASVDTTTTMAPETTTTVHVASLAPAAPPSAVAAVSGAGPSADVLPATGTRSVAPMVLLGSFLIVGGSALAAVRRRSRNA